MVIRIQGKCTCCFHPTDISMDIEPGMSGEVKLYIQDHSSGRGRIIINIQELKAALTAIEECQT